jgi:hypothetical protein
MPRRSISPAHLTAAGSAVACALTRARSQRGALGPPPHRAPPTPQLPRTPPLRTDALRLCGPTPPPRLLATRLVHVFSPLQPMCSHCGGHKPNRRRNSRCSSTSRDCSFPGDIASPTLANRLKRESSSTRGFRDDPRGHVAGPNCSPAPLLPCTPAQTTPLAAPSRRQPATPRRPTGPPAHQRSRQQRKQRRKPSRHHLPASSPPTGRPIAPWETSPRRRWPRPPSPRPAP